jgi:hypothetical protein
MSAQQSEPTAMDLAKEAVSQLVEDVIEEDIDNVVMTTAVVFYEVQYINEDGDLEFKVSYTTLTDSSMSSVIGTAMLGSENLMEAVSGDD